MPPAEVEIGPVVVPERVLDLAIALRRICVCLSDREAAECHSWRALPDGPRRERRVGGVIRKDRGGKRLEEEVVVAHLDLVDGPVAEDLRERTVELVAWPRRRLGR